CRSDHCQRHHDRSDNSGSLCNAALAYSRCRPGQDRSFRHPGPVTAHTCIRMQIGNTEYFSDTAVQQYLPGLCSYMLIDYDALCRIYSGTAECFQNSSAGTERVDDRWWTVLSGTCPGQPVHASSPVTDAFRAG